MKGLKMKYEKPMAAIEFYQLSQSIAACSIGISYLNRDCVISDNDTPDETRSIALLYPEYFSSPCVKNATAMQGNDFICVHTQVNALFTS